MEPWRGMHDSSWDEAQEDLLALGLTDGLPVVPPTRKRVNDMLGKAGVDRNAVLGTLPPAFSQVTWEDVAINAVLAGCEPAYLPVVGAAVAAITDPAFNLLGIATTTGSAATLVIVNGPIAREIGMNAEANALGPGNKANATIGRAVRLVLQNVGGAKSGTTDMATLGQPGKYTFCFAENEAASPWPPLHVERGFSADASVVTVVGTSGSVEVVDTVSAGAVDLARTYAQSMLIAGNVSGAGSLGGGEPLIVLAPEHAEVFDREGYSKDRAKAAIFEQGALPLSRLSNGVREHLASHAGATPLPDELRVARSAADIMIVVAGDVGRKGCYIPTWSGGTRAVSRVVA
jgi:hypothetical protein